MIDAGQKGRHPIGELDSRLRVARSGGEGGEWMTTELPAPRPFASALTQAAPELDPLAEPSVRKMIEDARAAAEEEGHRQGAARAESELAELRAAIEGVTAAIANATQTDAEAIADLALAVAAGLIGRAIDGDVDVLRASIASALTSLGTDTDLVIRVHPDDHTNLEDLDLEGASLVAEPTLERGEFEIDSPTCLVDARTQGRLEPLRDRLVALIREGEC